MLTLRSRGIAGTQKVDVLLPQRYDRSGRTRYPVLYLLHGAGGDHRTWLAADDAQAALGDLPVIAVMPDGSATGADGQRVNGGYSDWYGWPRGTAGRAAGGGGVHRRRVRAV